MKTAEEWVRLWRKHHCTTMAAIIDTARSEVVEALAKECDNRGTMVSYNLASPAFAKVVRAWWTAQQEEMKHGK